MHYNIYNILCGCMSVDGHLMVQHHTSSLTSGDFKRTTLVYLSLSGMAPASLATDCQLV